ncbi:hypothetical protein [Streptomyces abikoensis]|uniref:hypothetical protein n=1 Tax=Streptomyces abikoensis TaxID=97398 RepID=UPI00167B0309|nr:hypothetical protein [Streptomyces abikoensis]GGP55917.1 hypothetical protein GCM10010214_31390 [Streptomyces abikoensis]
MNETATCSLCLTPSGLPAHDRCRRRLSDALNELPDLYRALAAHLAPGRTGAASRRGSRTPPLPLRLDVLDLRAWGGIEGILTSWERDLCDRLGWATPPFRGTVEQQVDEAARLLRDNLDWIVGCHPAADDFASEIHAVVNQIKAVVTGETPERRLRLACTCGASLTITLSTPGRRCIRCGQQYGFQELRHLPLAARSAA